MTNTEVIEMCIRCVKDYFIKQSDNSNREDARKISHYNKDICEKMRGLENNIDKISVRVAEKLQERYETMCDAQGDNCYNCRYNMDNVSCSLIYGYELGRADAIEEFAEALKREHYALCAWQDEENFQYPSYLLIDDVYRHIDKIEEQLKEQE